jgi:hypothetical protein
VAQRDVAADLMIHWVAQLLKSAAGVLAAANGQAADAEILMIIGWACVSKSPHRGCFFTR